MAKLAELQQTNALYDDLLATVLAGAARRADQMTEAQRLAHEAMLDRLARKKLRFKIDSNDARETSATLGDILDECAIDAKITVANAVLLSSVAQNPESGIHDDSPTIDMRAVCADALISFASEITSGNSEDIRNLSCESIEVQLNQQGVNVSFIEEDETKKGVTDVMQMLALLNEEAASQWMAKQRAMMQAEDRMLAKMLKGRHKLSESKVQELESRRKEIASALSLLDALRSSFDRERAALKDRVDNEKSRQDNDMRARLANGKKKRIKSEIKDRDTENDQDSSEIEESLNNSSKVEEDKTELEEEESPVTLEKVLLEKIVVDLECEDEVFNIFDSLVIPGYWECPYCKSMQSSDTSSSCVQCLKSYPIWACSDLAAGSLPLHRVRELHQSMHGCCGKRSNMSDTQIRGIIKMVHQQYCDQCSDPEVAPQNTNNVESVLRKDFLVVMAALHIFCARSIHLAWETEAMWY